MVLSHYELQPVNEARRSGIREISIRVDLGRASVRVHLTPCGIEFPSGLCLSWEEVEEIITHPNVCFRWDERGLQRLQRFSFTTGRLVSLYPTGGAPTITLSGIPMHRIQGTDPWKDTLAKIRAARPRGKVLDTCMGLGYTALAAARTADFVLTVELDPAVIDIARENPWSVEVFHHERIHIIQADVGELITTFPPQTFSVVIHDPPMFALAGNLYSLEFYRELHRVLTSRGRLFHYIGNPEGKMARNLTRSVSRRLRQAGFRKIIPARQAFGVIASK